MNTAHWHLMLNHIPILGALIGTLVIAGGTILGRNAAIRRTGLLILVGSAVLAIPAFLTGEGAEEIAERLPGVTENSMDHHEELGENFFRLMIVLGLLALLTLIADWRKLRAAGWLYYTVLAFGVAASVYSKTVATSGGEIRHTEIRQDAGVAAGEAAGGEQEKKGGKEGDDD
jgi:uncharacterized membrane protein